MSLLLVCGLGVTHSWAQSASDPTAALDRALSEAEVRLAAGELDAAERRYRAAFFEGWLLLARLNRAAGRVEDARLAVGKAAPFVPAGPEAALALASAQLEAGDAAAAVSTLIGQGSSAGGLETLRLLVRALAAAGREDDAVRRLDAAAAAAAGDPEVAFVLATDYLWLNRLEAADRLLAQVVAYRPVAETHVLVGRAYRDTGVHDRARQELQLALAKDSKVRRAHYYLGTVALADPAAGTDRLEQAIGEFRAELVLSGDDPLVLDQLGLALIEIGRPAEAVRTLERAVQLDPRASYLHHLGRAQLAAGQPQPAVDSLRRALTLAASGGAASADLETMHYRLGTALRQLGPAHEEEAAEHFTEARRLAARWTNNTQALTALDAAATGPSREAAVLAPSAETAADPPVPLGQREALAAHVRSSLARAYLNLGVMQAKAGTFTSASSMLEEAAELAPGLPGVQYALGVARFNGGNVAGSLAPLIAAVERDPGNRAARHLLALASISGEAYTRAIDLLRPDPDVAANPPLQVALGLALARGGRAEEAEAVFTRLLNEHGPSAPLLVGVGEALAHQGKLEPALVAVARAWALDPRVEDAGTLRGFVLLQQKQFAQAEAALRAELDARLGHARTRRLLAAALAAQGQGDEAVRLLREVIETWPEAADSHLELGRIHERRGETALAEEHFGIYRRLTGKDGRGG